MDHDFIAHLNGECLSWAGMDGAALQQALRAQGDTWHALVQERCPHLFASVPVFVSDLQWQQMLEVIAAAEQAFGATAPDAPRGVFYGYDFHLNAEGAHLIEINTNAGGAFLNALLIDSQHAAQLYGEAVSVPDLESVFIAMFREEWRRARGAAPLRSIAIVDEQPQEQYLYPEFLLAKALFERHGITAVVADPGQLLALEEGLYLDGLRIDMVYNRLTDFELREVPPLRQAWQRGQVLVTPGPQHHARYADKRKLAWLSDAAALRAAGVADEAISALQRGLPHTELVHAQDATRWWSERKQWFFKPVSGYGSKGAYRGDKMTKRVFDEVMQADYVAQKLAAPGERMVCLADGTAQMLKFDVRCYVYAGQVQLVAARLYQGQTTNFRTPGGGFALVRRVS